MFFEPAAAPAPAKLWPADAVAVPTGLGLRFLPRVLEREQLLAVPAARLTALVVAQWPPEFVLQLRLPQRAALLLWLPGFPGLRFQNLL